MPSLGRVGILLFPKFEMLDVYGPFEMLGLLAELDTDATIVTVAQQAGPVTNSAVMWEHGESDCSEETKYPSHSEYSAQYTPILLKSIS